MQCYTELVPPSGVTHALSIPFLSATANNLVVAKSSLLQIFSLVTVTSEDASSSLPEDQNDQSAPGNTKLLLEAEYDLPGTITDLGRVKILDSKSGGEAILISVRNAKLSLIEWDPKRHCISTVSIHYYEREDLHHSPWAPDLSKCESHLAVDPSSRCAVLNFGVRNLAILPFHQPGDDLVMDDYDADLDGERLDQDGNGTGESGQKESHQTPYASSFVLPMTALDPSLLHPINMAFLYEYREPTFGILYSQVATSASLLFERKDVVYYGVFTLDLEQRASTALLSVPRLPNDLSKVVALPPSVGGALLVGGNEIVHVDQSGKTNAVGVNEFARQASNFSMADQSDLGMRLEGCTVEQLGNDSGDMVIILSTGEMALLTFKLDGRSVSGLSLQRVPEAAGGSLLKSQMSCSAFMGQGKIFFGSEDADSALVGWSLALSSKKSRAPQKQGTDELEEILEMDEDDVYEDDLYSTSAPLASPSTTSGLANGSGHADHRFFLHDQLHSIGPIRDFALGRPPALREDKGSHANGINAELELVAAQGSGQAGGLVVLNRELSPRLLESFAVDDAQGLWSVRVQDPKSKSDSSAESSHDRFLIVSKSKGSDKEESLVCTIGDSGLEELKAPEFNPNEDITIDIGCLAGGSRVVQVLQSEVRSYETDLRLAQIYPVWDEDTGDERTAVRASFADPYLLIIRDDSTPLLLQSDDSGDLEEITLDEGFSSNKWLCGSLYKDTAGWFIPVDGEKGENGSEEYLLFLLSADGKLHIFRLPNAKEPAYVVQGVDLLLSYLSSDPLPKRLSTREKFTEIVVAELGDASAQSPHLILRTENDDLIVYKPYHVANGTEELNNDLRFIKCDNHYLPRSVSEPVPETSDDAPRRATSLRVLPSLGNFKSVFMPGDSPTFVMRSSANQPHLIPLRGKAVKGLCGLNTPTNENGFAYIDSDNILRICQLPPHAQFENTWVNRKFPLDEQIDFITYSPTSETYVLGASRQTDFKLPDDNEIHTEWRNEMISFLPKVEQGSVKVLSPKTWAIIDSYDFEPAERVMCVQNLSLEVSETTHERKDMIAVGTTTVGGEDIAAKGCVYVFEVIEVVPDPEKPETNRKLKLFAKENVKGAVTALSGIGGQGFLVVAQGQKCMVRGLKEDGSLLPVAFMDVQCYVSVLKELQGSGMCIIGDAVKGVWFTGYSEDPYKMTLFGKDNGELEVVAADFLPDGDQLFIIVADGDCNLHVLQYDPEHPKSSKGDRLLHRSTFYSGHFGSTVTILPRTATSSELVVSNEHGMDVDLAVPSHQTLVTAQTGSIALITPVSEESYRRLSALQSQLTNTLEHPGGLNPRAYRAVESDGVGGRGMIDGSLLQKWLDLSMQRRAEIAGRVGADVWEIRSDLESIGGAGLGYL